MLSCKDVTHKISQAQDHTLTRRERIAVRLHLLICGACRHFVRQLAILTAVSRRVLSEDVPADDKILSEAARHRIRDKMRNITGNQDGTEE